MAIINIIIIINNSCEHQEPIYEYSQRPYANAGRALKTSRQ
jgi:hypothetical protein